MNRLFVSGTTLIGAFCLGLFFNSIFYFDLIPPTNTQPKTNTAMKLGAFSMSLSVKNLEASRVFYENLGFTQFGGAMESNYLIMKNESTLIGLFQGMFEENILTFNPGWDDNAKKVEGFQDVRKIQQHLKSTGAKIINPADENTSGPASFWSKIQMEI